MAITIPLGVILIWDSTNASIPAGWKRTTALDGLFPKSYGAQGVNTAGGNLTHSHNATANHGHTMDAHTHAFQLSDVAQHSSNSSDANGSEGPPGHHSHSGVIGGLSGGELSSVASTYDAVSNDPPFRTVVFIEPDTVPASLLNNISSLWNDVAPPTGWVFCDGTNTTLDLRNRYLKGADGGGDAGGIGGSTLNLHPLTHTHVEAVHAHSGVITGAEAAGGFNRAGAGSNRLSGGHSHAIVLNANTAGGISSVILTTSEVVEPLNKKLSAIKNTSGGASQPRFIIGMWLADPTLIPSGWNLCDGNNGTPNLTNFYVKVMSNSSELGNTSGSNTHSHAGQSHSHTGSSHTHTGNNTDTHSAKNTLGPVGGNRDLQDGGADHSFVSIGNSPVSWGATPTVSDSANNEPQYKTVVYIMFNGVPANSQRSGQVSGKQDITSQRGAEMYAVEPLEERRAEVSGKEATSSRRNAEISGMIEWVREPKPVLTVQSA